MEENINLFEERKEKIADYISSNEYLPMKRNEIAIMLSVPSDERMFFEDIINELIEEGRAIETKKGKIMSPKSLNYFTGTFTSHARGFGFVTV